MSSSVQLWGGPLDGKEYAQEEVYVWGSCPTSINVINDLDPQEHLTYYRTGQVVSGRELFRIGATA